MGLLPVLPLNVEIIVIAIAVAYTVMTVFLQRKLANPKRMREIQYKVKILQKEMNDMLKRKAPQNELIAKQREFMPLMGEQMKQSMKPMLVILPLLAVTYYVLLPMLPVGASNIGGSRSLFFIVVFSLGLVAAAVIMIYDRNKSKQEQKEAAIAADVQNSQ